MQGKNKQIWVFSDMVEQTRVTTDFARFENDPSVLISSEYEKIKKEMLELQPLGNLEGMTIKFIYPDLQGEYMLAHFSRLFFQKLFTEFGATVEILPNI